MSFPSKRLDSYLKAPFKIKELITYKYMLQFSRMQTIQLIVIVVEF